eukprot:scaffold1318_cov362-Pavlova_lutheri.AAC.18
MGFLGWTLGSPPRSVPFRTRKTSLGIGTSNRVCFGSERIGRKGRRRGNPTTSERKRTRGRVVMSATNVSVKGAWKGKTRRQVSCKSRRRNVWGTRITSAALDKLVEAQKKLQHYLRKDTRNPNHEQIVAQLEEEIEQLQKQVEMHEGRDEEGLGSGKDQAEIYRELEAENELLRAKLKEKIEMAKEKGKEVSEDLVTSLEMLQIQAEKHALQKKIQDMLQKETAIPLGYKGGTYASALEEDQKYQELQGRLRDVVGKIRANVSKHQEKSMTFQASVESQGGFDRRDADIPDTPPQVQAEEATVEETKGSLFRRLMSSADEMLLSQESAHAFVRDLFRELDESEFLDGKEHELLVLLPEIPVAGEKCRAYFNRVQSNALRDRPQIVLEGGFNGWMWETMTLDLLPSSSARTEQADWWMCELSVPPEAYDLQFVFHDSNGVYENNDEQNFVFDVLHGLSPEGFQEKLEELELEQKLKEREEEERQAKLAMEAKQAERDAQDAQFAREEVLAKYQEALNIIADGKALMASHMWKIFPSKPIPGRKAKLYYNMGCSCLNHTPLKLHFGFNCWWEDGIKGIPLKDAATTRTSEAEMYVFPDGSTVNKGGDQLWLCAEVEVPVDALTFDFVVSDADGMFDNNSMSDYHILIQDEEVLQPYLAEAINQRTLEIRTARKKAEKEEEERQQQRKLRKERMKQQALSVFRKQQMHIYYTQPEVPVAGEKVTVYYNPNNTNLNGRADIFLRGGWNRWTHPNIIQPVKMRPCEDTGVCSLDHLQASLVVPSDAYVLDLVFSDKPDVGDHVTFDNRGGLDYHIPVEGSSKPEPPMHIVHVAVEMAPICKVGGLGDVVTSISRAVKDLGHRVEVVVPKYDVIDYSQVSHLREIEGYQWGNCYNHIYHGIVEGLDVYFIDPDNGFFRSGCIYGADWLPIPMTDSERFGFFSRSSLEFLLQSGRQPDIIHCHDWSTAPVAKVYWDNYHHFGLERPKIAFTIHNLNYGAGLISEAITYSQKATTVSPTYAREVSGNPAVAHGVHAGKFHGIRNGIDLDIWDPEGDPFLPIQFSPDNCIEGKAAAKKSLRERLNLAEVDCPLVGVVTRLTAQKGMHLIEHAIYTAISRGCQFVLLGSAFDVKVQQHWNEVASRLSHEHHHMVRLHFEYNEPLSHLVYAGSDMLLVPSIFEPCGLSQLIAMRYGTVPIVRKTGGLYDTVFDVDHDQERAKWEMREPNGFNFDGADPAGVDYALNRAVDRWYTDKEWWKELVGNDMQQDWSWNRPAIDYIELYHAAIHG